MSLTPQDIDAICDLVKDLCGLCLDDTKSYLIEHRLARLVRRSGCEGYAEFARRARSTDDRHLHNEIIDAITTNETLFFRDESPFQALQHKVLPELFDGRADTLNSKRIRIWCAACSTGQEPYSIAMVLHELLPDVHGWDINILGTDISDSAIQRASRAWYARYEVDRGLSKARLKRFFVPQDNGWRLCDEVRALVSFRRRNILDSFNDLGTFDVVFCRNVAIYFSEEDRRNLFHRIAEIMPAEGVLFVGSAESLSDLGPRFQPHQYVKASLYRPNSPAAVQFG